MECGAWEEGLTPRTEEEDLDPIKPCLGLSWKWMPALAPAPPSVFPSSRAWQPHQKQQQELGVTWGELCDPAYFPPTQCFSFLESPTPQGTLNWALMSFSLSLSGHF